MSEKILDCIFEEVCQQYPSNTALVMEDGLSSLSYNELNKLSNNLAAVLKDLLESAGTDSSGAQLMNPTVSIMTERNFAMIIGILAILKVGASYVPVDPAFPPDRQSHIFSHSRSKILIADTPSYQKAINLGVNLPLMLVIDPITGKLSEEKFASKSCNLGGVWTNVRNEADMAYVLYTSGSTGKPKGVMVTHKGVVNIVNWFADELGVDQNSVVLGLTTFCFDISVLEMFMPLFRGATLVIAVSSTQKDPFRLLEVIKLRGVNIVQATPTTFEMMLATGWTGDTTLDFLVGGEAFRPSLVPLITNSHSLRNVYGPTETTIWSSSYNFKGKLPETSGALVVPVGSPISETSFYLVRDGGGLPFQLVKETEKEQEGELFIGGIGVALGYLHAPELTAERFIPNPFGEGYVYRTGDLVKRLDDGNYVFVRRLDDQVKVNGYRIELAEVELGLGSYRSVDQVVVIVRNSQLVAYIKPKKDVEFNSNEIQALKEHAGRSLTAYMLPKHFVIVDSFPQTANGKLDRKALPDPPLVQEDRFHDGNDGSNNNDDAEEVKEGCLDNPLEITMTQHVCGIVEKLRGYRPRPTASLATLGIDSLGSILFVKYLSDSLGGIPIDLKMVYSPGVTIKSLSEELYNKLVITKPEVISDLHIVELSQNERMMGTTTKDIETGQGVYHTNAAEKILEVESEEEEFDDHIFANKRLFEGIRGVLTLLVLWDHFHGHDPSPYTLKADTQLFVILSGFTTCLQLRTSRNSKNIWNWRSFLFTRFVGVFPMLWLALILHIPRWYPSDTNVVHHAVSSYKLQHHYRHGYNTTTSTFKLPHWKHTMDPTDREHVCSFLYVIGMQTWVSKDCSLLGPQDVYYASVIWNCFLMYAIFRVLLHLLQKSILFSDNDKSSQKCSDGKGRGESISNYILPQLIDMAINQMNRRTFSVMCLVWLLLHLLVFQLLKNNGAYVVYFSAGAVAACMAENAYWLTNGKATAVVTPTNTNAIYDITKSNLMLTQEEASSTNHYISITMRLLQRFLPDLAILSIFLIFVFGGLQTNSTTSFYRVHLIPILFILSIVSSLLQTKTTRNGGLWRYLTESSLMTLIGYCSYPIYLLQQVLLNFYGRILADDIQQGAFPLIKGGSNPNKYGAYYDDNWFSIQRWYWRLFGIVCIIIICYPIQRFFPDGLIASITSQFLLWQSKLKVSKSNNLFSSHK